MKTKFKSLKRKILYRPPNKDKILDLISTLRPKITDKQLIRLGGDKDGGYLVPNDLNNIEACFSPGVGNISSFEYSCADLGMKIFMADASVTNPVPEDDQFQFIQKFVGKSNGSDFITLERWMQSTGINGKKDLILQMDIEGSEFEVLNCTSVNTLKRFRIIIVEFHKLHQLWNPLYFYKAKKAFKKLLENHICVHIHPNNCCGNRTINDIDFPVVAEFTFIRKDRVKELGMVTSLPHILDQDNTDQVKLSLPKIWYS